MALGDVVHTAGATSASSHPRGLTTGQPKTLIHRHRPPVNLRGVFPVVLSCGAVDHGLHLPLKVFIFMVDGVFIGFVFVSLRLLRFSPVFSPMNPIDHERPGPLQSPLSLVSSQQQLAMMASR